MSGDGRYIDPNLGSLSGEGSHQRVKATEERLEQLARDAWTHVPSDTTAGPTYYDRPVIKEPVWKPAVAAYFYTGGTAGAASTLAAIAQVFGRGRMRGLVKRARAIAAGGTTVGMGLLVYDLGRKSRFLNMLRVFRPTSPMSVGSWMLGASTTASAGAIVFGERAPLVGDLAGLAAGAGGLPLSGYTAALVSNSAVPIWQAVRTSLPPLFVSSAANGAASLLDMMDLTGEEARVVNRFGVMGKIGELVAAEAVTKDAERVERIAMPLKEGFSGSLWRLAKLSTSASLALSLLPGRARWKRWITGLLGTIGAVSVRFAIYYAGIASARDPRATFEQQRAGYGGTEVTGRAAVTGPNRERAI
ncbi:MAG TPA: NrfD/PsrC family molybdoenzyme membrane anchor subunit [Actinomycetota bacterium]|nr:NrfD/PsrC family molybdoenzyme membrane anchor subunit [Actinomycetota bacterium]